MPTYGPNAPTAAVNVDSASTFNPWVNPTNILLSNNVYADGSSGVGQPTDDLIVTGYGFTIPGGEYVTGIEVAVEGKKTGPSATAGRLTMQVNVAGSPGNIGTTQSHNWPSISEAVFVYGSSSTTFSASFTPAMCNHVNFGFKIVAEATAGLGNILDLDSALITIYTALPSVVLKRRRMMRGR